MDAVRGVRHGALVVGEGHAGAIPLGVKWKPLNAPELLEEKRKGAHCFRKIKARLTPRGDQDGHRHSKETESPTAGKVEHRVVAHTAVQNGWPLVSFDIKGAFFPLRRLRRGAPRAV